MNKAWWFALIIVGMLLGAGILLLVTRPPRGDPVALLPPPSPMPIQVYVSGEVDQPGLYSLPPGSRVNDAIQAAGGLSSEAKKEAINLAKLLQDGEQVIVPGIIALPMDGGSSENNPSPGLININTATLEQLDTLPEIGPATASDIIEWRNSHGLFASIENIMDVPGIGQGTFDKIKDLITTGTSIP